MVNTIKRNKWCSRDAILHSCRERITEKHIIWSIFQQSGLHFLLYINYFWTVLNSSDDKCIISPASTRPWLGNNIRLAMCQQADLNLCDSVCREPYDSKRWQWEEWRLVPFWGYWAGNPLSPIRQKNWQPSSAIAAVQNMQKKWPLASQSFSVIPGWDPGLWAQESSCIPDFLPPGRWIARAIHHPWLSLSCLSLQGSQTTAWDRWNRVT